MSHAAVYETIAEPAPAASSFPEVSPEAVRRSRVRGGVLLASLAGAFVTTCLSGASLYYAFSHIPQVDPDADAAQVAAVAAITADAPTTPAKLAVLTPPVYGPELLSEAPAAPFVPLSARVSATAIDMNALTQTDGTQADATQTDASQTDASQTGGSQTGGVTADGTARPCADPCSAQAGYAAPVATDPPASIPVSNLTRPANTDTDDDGNAPPPPDMVVN